MLIGAGEERGDYKSDCGPVHIQTSKTMKGLMTKLADVKKEEALLLNLL